MLIAFHLSFSKRNFRSDKIRSRWPPLAIRSVGLIHAPSRHQPSWPTCDDVDGDHGTNHWPRHDICILNTKPVRWRIRMLRQTIRWKASKLSSDRDSKRRSLLQVFQKNLHGIQPSVAKSEARMSTWTSIPGQHNLRLHWLQLRVWQHSRGGNQTEGVEGRKDENVRILSQFRIERLTSNQHVSQMLIDPLRFPLIPINVIGYGYGTDSRKSKPDSNPSLTWSKLHLLIHPLI